MIRAWFLGSYWPRYTMELNINWCGVQSLFSIVANQWVLPGSAAATYLSKGNKQLGQISKFYSYLVFGKFSSMFLFFNSKFSSSFVQLKHHKFAIPIFRQLITSPNQLIAGLNVVIWLIWAQCFIRELIIRYSGEKLAKCSFSLSRNYNQHFFIYK